VFSAPYCSHCMPEIVDESPASDAERYDFCGTQPLGACHSHAILVYPNQVRLGLFGTKMSTFGTS
jgi:hypothetical protein